MIGMIINLSSIAATKRKLIGINYRFKLSLSKTLIGLAIPISPVIALSKPIGAKPIKRNAIDDRFKP